ncbi:MAG: hypothetical protein ACXVPU_18270, partial [Bacteroidia bacterium]
NLLHAIEILYYKGLFKQCDKVIQKAKALAEKYEYFQFQLQILDWESRTIIALADFERLNLFLQKDLEHKQKLIDQHKMEIELKHLEEKILHLTKALGHPRNDDEKSMYRKIMNHPLLKDEKKGMLFRAKFYFLNINSIYYEVLGDNEQTYEYRKKLIEFADGFPHMIKEEQIKYVICLNNLLNSQDELKKYDELKKTLHQLRSIETRSPNIQARIFAYSYNLEQTQSIISGDFKKVVEKHPEVEEGIKKNKNFMHKEFLVAFKYQFFYGYFGIGDFNNSLKYMNQLLNEDTIKVRQEIYFFARIMNLIIHYELGNFELLAYNIRSTYRFFLSRKRLFKFETVMMDFIKESSKFNSQKEIKAGYISLKSRLEKLADDPYESQVLGFFDIISWLESKISGRSFAQIVKEKNKM